VTGEPTHKLSLHLTLPGFVLHSTLLTDPDFTGDRRNLTWVLTVWMFQLLYW